MSLGSDLKAARGSKGISLDDISKKTKIPMKFLVAIEEDRFDAFPSHTFAKAFVRAYAKMVGMDPALMTRQFNSEVKPRTVPIVPKNAESEVEKNLGWRPVLDRPPVFRRPDEESDLNLEIVEEVPSQRDPSVMKKKALAFKTKSWLLGLRKAAVFLAAVVLVTACVYYGGKALGRLKSAPAPQDAPSAAVPAQPLKVVDKYQHLVLKALDKSWVQVVVDDGKSHFQADMAKGDVKIFKATRNFQVRLGNAGGVEVQFNGKSLGVLGVAGQVKDLALPPGTVLTHKVKDEDPTNSEQ